MNVFNRLFGKFSFTDLNSKDEKRHPVIVRMSINRVYEKLKAYIECNQCATNKVYSVDFYQLYYEEKGCEITLLLLADKDMKIIVSSHVRCSIPGRSLKCLYHVLNDVNEVLNK